MADNTINDTLSKAAAASQGTATSQPTAKSSKNEAISQQEFLTLLVNQLQHQDPLNPMDSQQFAVQLAQFSSLEQLVQINGKLDNQGGSSAGSMATFLGHEVALKDQVAFIDKQQGPNAVVDFPEGIQSARVDLVGADGKVAGSVNLDSVQAGQQVISLDGAKVPTGSYELRVVGVNAEGRFQDVPATVTGTVEGFVMEPEPALIVDGEEMTLADVKQVFRGKL